jgi:hypothetical protein
MFVLVSPHRTCNKENGVTKRKIPMHYTVLDKQQVVFVEPGYCVNVHGQKV